MADLADIAGEHDFNEEVMARHRNQAPSIIKRGTCLCCEEEIAEDKVYCDIDCRNTHEREQRLKNLARK